LSTLVEKPGPICESFFFPGEEVDTRISDREPERQDEFGKGLEAPNGLHNIGMNRSEK
jgi:hypothetical protein